MSCLKSTTYWISLFRILHVKYRIKRPNSLSFFFIILASGLPPPPPPSTSELISPGLRLTCVPELLRGVTFDLTTPDKIRTVRRRPVTKINSWLPSGGKLRPTAAGSPPACQKGVPWGHYSHRRHFSLLVPAVIGQRQRKPIAVMDGSGGKWNSLPG